MKTLLAVNTLLLAGGAAYAAVVTYTREADFVARLGAYELEDFDDFSYGDVYPEDTLRFGTIDGFSYLLHADGGLWANDGSISSDDELGMLDIFMTGDDVYAVGGYFFATNIDGEYIAEMVRVELHTGPGEIILPNDPYGDEPTFLGFISDEPILGLSIAADHTQREAWPTVDHLYVGDLVPAPASAALVSLAGVLIRRRR